MTNHRYRTWRGQEIEWSGEGIYASYDDGYDGRWIWTNDVSFIEQTLRQGRGLAWVDESMLDEEEESDEQD